MAIAFDAKSNNSSGATTWSHTCTGSNLVLVVLVAQTTGSTAITGVTYNGISMTQSQNVVDGYNFATFYLVNPSTGTHTVSVSHNTTTGGLFGGSVSFSGANTTSPVDTTPTYVSNTGGPLSWTTNYNNSFLFDAVIENGSNLSGVNSGQTLQWRTVYSTQLQMGSTKPTTTAGSYTTGYTTYSADLTRIWGIAIREAASAPSANSSYLMNLM